MTTTEEKRIATILHMRKGSVQHSEKHHVFNDEQLQYAEDRYLKVCGVAPMTDEAYDIIESGMHKDGDDSFYLILLKDFWTNGKSKRRI